jgi:hypothetical protein
MKNYVLTFLMVFSFNTWADQSEPTDLIDHQEEILQIQDLEFLPVYDNEKTISFTRWLAFITVASFLFDSFSFTAPNGKIIYTFHPTSTAFKWAGKGCQFMAIALSSLNL